MEAIPESGTEQQVLGLVEQLRGIVANPYPDPASVAPLRWRIAQALLEHCERKDAIASGLPAVATMARREDHAALCCLFSHYIADWSVARIGAEWRQFGKETEDLVASLTYVVGSNGAAPDPDMRRAA